MGLNLKYGETKTCCWSPSFPQGLSDEDCAARNACSSLPGGPGGVPRLAGGMAVLGSFIGTDEYVMRCALAQVEDAASTNPRSIRRTAEACAAAATSAARNARDLSGVLLRVCVVAKCGYLCRTLRPDLAAPALKRADDLCASAFSVIYAINRGIFNLDASAEQRFAATCVRMPTSLNGCGLRSAVTTSEAAYVAFWRAVAPAIAAASPAGARSALADLGGEPTAPCLRALAAAARRAAVLLPGADGEALDLPDFCNKPEAGLQRKILVEKTSG